MPVLVLFKPWWDFYVTKIVDSSGSIISHLKNCILLGPNWWILLGFWKGQIEKKFQSGIHLGQFRFWRGRNGTCSARFGLNSPQRTSRGQISPKDIGANSAFGVNLALFILQCYWKDLKHNVGIPPTSNGFLPISRHREN